MEANRVIFFNEQTKVFTLHTNQVTYQMQVDHLGYLIHLYNYT